VETEIVDVVEVLTLSPEADIDGNDDNDCVKVPVAEAVAVWVSEVESEGDAVAERDATVENEGV
jgi:hypothetical protein